MTKKDKWGLAFIIILLVGSFIYNNPVDITLFILGGITIYFVIVAYRGKWGFRRNTYQLLPSTPSGGAKLIAIIIIALLLFQIYKIQNDKEYYEKQYQESLSNGLLKAIPIAYIIIKPVHFIRDIIVQKLLEDLSNMNEI